MSASPDERDPLAILLRGIATPEPPPDFLAGARRRYLRAVEARYRHEVIVALVAASMGLAVAAGLLLLVFEPVALIGAAALAAADAARWVTGAAAVLSIVPLAGWMGALAIGVASTLPIVFFARSRRAPSMK